MLLDVIVNHHTNVTHKMWY